MLLDRRQENNPDGDNLETAILKMPGTHRGEFIHTSQSIFLRGGVHEVYSPGTKELSGVIPLLFSSA